MEENKDFGQSLNAAQANNQSSGNIQQNMQEEGCDNWYEFRTAKMAPERRSYHSTFVFESRVFIYGGLDIREGSMDSMYELDMDNISDLDAIGEERQTNFGWKLVKTIGEGPHRPSKMAYHTSVVYKENMYISGGNGQDGHYDIFQLNLRKMEWQIVRLKGNIPKKRDEHTSVVNQQAGLMYIFGGYLEGTRMNDIQEFCFNTNTWSQVPVDQCSPAPVPRSGHSAVFYNDCMYVFGGKDDDSEKLNDLWQFNFLTSTWKKIETGQPNEEIPLTRSGHSSSVYRDYMVVFGGIHEITKELNDLILFSFSSNKWIILERDTILPLKAANGLSPSQGPNDLKIQQNTQSVYADNSPSRYDGSPTKTSSMTKLKRAQSSVKSKRKNAAAAAQLNIGAKNNNVLAMLIKTQNLNYNQQVNLNSPTSISMKSTFLIQNHNSNFDLYYHQMKKRKANQQQSNNFQSTGSIFKKNEAYGRMKGRRPPARDGHTGVVYQDCLVIFGGDRHHMPFNDSYMFDLRQEFISRNLS